MRGMEDCVIDAACAEWGRVVFTNSERYRVGCGGLVGAAFACEVMGEDQSGVSIEDGVVSASAVASVGSSASRDGGGCVLIVGHFYVVYVCIMVGGACSRGLRVCRV